MDTLTLVQTIFYIVASLAIISLGILFSIVGYNMIYLTKDLRGISENLNSISAEVKNRFSEALEKIFSLPFLSFFSSRSAKKKNKQENKTKGRNNS